MLLYRFIDRNFIARPHRFMPLLVFIGTVLYFLLDRHSVFYTFAPADPDDYMRLDETINWLRGQGWYDLSQPRLSPGAHTVIHWARLLDVPIAALMWPFLKEWGYRSSAMLAALIEPLILLVLLLALVPRMTKPLLGRGDAKLATLFVPLIGSLLFNFSPGRVDHHNYEILIGGVGLMALQYMILCRGGWRAGIFAGIAFAAGLWISPEIMPCIILTLGALALYAAWRGGFLLCNAAVFGTAFAVATAALLPAALPAAQWNDRTISWFSGAYVIFAALAGAIFIIAWLLGRHTQSKILRLALIAALIGFAATLFIYAVPDAMHGPFADYDSFDATTALENIGEAEPLSESLHILPYNHLSWGVVAVNYVHFVLPEMLALMLCIWGFLTAPRRRAIWAVNGILLGGTTALAVFLQYRVLWFAQIFELGPMAYIVFRFWDWFEGRWSEERRLHAALIAFFVLSPAPLFTTMMVQHESQGGCDLKPAAEFIAGPWGYIDRTYTILAGSNDGPELLFRTPHNVLAANFDVPANRDVYDFFTARNDIIPQNILRRWHVDLVLTCRSIPPLYTGTDHARFGKNAFFKLGKDGKLHIVSNLSRPTLAEKLIDGQTPGWLNPVEIPASKDYLLFEVHLPRPPTSSPR
jgi:hypothetical protein